MKTKYALSYHVMHKIDELMNSIVFTSENIAKRFIKGLNKILDTRGYVSISVLCDRAEIKITDEDRDAFDRIAWKDRIADTMVTPTMRDGELMYKIIFPPLVEIDPVWIEEDKE